MHSLARGGETTLAMLGRIQFMVQGCPPRVTDRWRASGNGALGEDTRRRWREPESVALREGGAAAEFGGATCLAEAASRASRAGAQDDRISHLVHREGLVRLRLA